MRRVQRIVCIAAVLAGAPSFAAGNMATGTAPRGNATTTTSACSTKSGAVAEQAPPFPVAHGFSHTLQKWSGVNWLTNASLSSTACLFLSLRTGSWVKANIGTYNFTDLLSGKFRYIDLRTHGGKLNGVPLGKLHVGVDRPFQLQYFKHKRPNGTDRSGLKTAVLLNLEGDITEHDFAVGLKSPKVSSGLRLLKLDLPGLGEQRLQVLQPRVDLQNDKVQVDTVLITAGAPKETGIQVRVLASPVLEKERYIVLKDMNVSSPDIPNPKDFSLFLEELFNPLVDFGRMDRKTRAFRLTRLNVSNDHVTFGGRLLLAPSTP